MLRGVLSVRLGDGPRGVFEPAPPLFTRVDIAGTVRSAMSRKTGPQGLPHRNGKDGVDANKPIRRNQKLTGLFLTLNAGFPTPPFIVYRFSFRL